MTDMTPEYLAELRALADAATEGPWWGGGNNRRRDAIGLVGRTSDRGTGNAIAVLNGIGMDRTAGAVFIAAARTAVPELLDEIERLRRLLAELTDPDPCWFDHNGGCQAHGYLTLRPGETCPQYDAQQIRAALVADEQAQPDPAAEDWWDQDRQVPR